MKNDKGTLQLKVIERGQEEALDSFISKVNYELATTFEGKNTLNIRYSKENVVIIYKLESNGNTW